MRTHESPRAEALGLQRRKGAWPLFGDRAVVLRRRVGLVVLAAALSLSVNTRAYPAPPGQNSDGRTLDPVHAAIRSMYNLDFEAAHRTLDEHIAGQPGDPLGYAARAAALIFAEFDRMKILELDFFDDDDRITGGTRLQPDSQVRDRIFAGTAEARRLAAERLSRQPADRHALFALTMAVGIETQYTTIVEKRYLRGGSLSKESQQLADRMLTLQPPVYDAYVTLGAIEYTVANLNPIYRFFARLRGLRGSKEKAVEHLRLVIANGAYYGPYAKILLAVFHVREKQFTQARELLEDLRRSFPANPLFDREIARIDTKLASGGR